MSDAPAVEDVAIVVRNASRSLARLLESDPDAHAVLENLDRRAPVDTSSVDGLVRWKRHEFLRIAARDLLRIDAFEPVAAALSAMAADVLDAAVGLADADGLAVIGMGKLGGRELNYASDVDVMLVSDGEHDPAVVDRSACRDRHRPPLLPCRSEPAPRRTRRRARALAAVVRGVLGSLGRGLGVPGAPEGTPRGW